MNLLHTVLLSTIEGVTEFLPISSTAHLIITEKLLGFNDTNSVFTVVIQLGAVVAAAWYFKTDILTLTRQFITAKHKTKHPFFMVFLALIPAGIAGLVLEQTTGIISSPTVIALSLIIGGIILWVTEHLYSSRSALAADEQVRYHSITTRQAIIVGLSQCIALIPGVSRSGATIVSGLSSGMNRATATAFSFYLSIPLLAAASALKIIKYRSELAASSDTYIQLLFGVVVAGVCAFFVVGWLLKYVSHHSLKSFAYYRVALGIIILLFIARP